MLTNTVASWTPLASLWLSSLSFSNDIDNTEKFDTNKSKQKLKTRIVHKISERSRSKKSVRWIAIAKMQCWGDMEPGRDEDAQGSGGKLLFRFVLLFVFVFVYLVVFVFVFVFVYVVVFVI